MYSFARNPEHSVTGEKVLDLGALGEALPLADLDQHLRVALRDPLRHGLPEHVIRNRPIEAGADEDGPLVLEPLRPAWPWRWRPSRHKSLFTPTEKARRPPQVSCPTTGVWNSPLTFCLSLPARAKVLSVRMLHRDFFLIRSAGVSFSGAAVGIRDLQRMGVNRENRLSGVRFPYGNP